MDNAKAEQADALEFLGMAMVMGSSRAIETQEKNGQTNFCNSDRLPIDMKMTTREELEAIGFVFGEKLDDLFVQCKLPNGWTRRATDHSMWSDIIDDQGRERAHVFYKAAFYDLKAFVTFITPETIPDGAAGSP